MEATADHFFPGPGGGQRVIIPLGSLWPQQLCSESQWLPGGILGMK